MLFGFLIISGCGKPPESEDYVDANDGTIFFINNLGTYSFQSNFLPDGVVKFNVFQYEAEALLGAASTKTVTLPAYTPKGAENTIITSFVENIFHNKANLRVFGYKIEDDNYITELTPEIETHLLAGTLNKEYLVEKSVNMVIVHNGLYCHKKSRNARIEAMLNKAYMEARAKEIGFWHKSFNLKCDS